MQFEIYFADLNPVIGREQAGKRPVLVISNDIENELDIVTVIPITSRKDGRRIYPNETLFTLADKEAIILCHQIRTISKARLTQKVGKITDGALKAKIYHTLCMRFDEIGKSL